MVRLRIEALAKFISKEDKVVDIGCDHAYLAIHLMQNEMCKKVVASDIHANALLSAKKNIQNAHLDKKIPTILSDGFSNIDVEVDTAVISGMGASTILHIIKNTNPKGIKKYVLQSNNDLYRLRSSLEEMGYFLNEEKVVFEKGHYYVIGLYTLHGKKLSIREKLFGIYAQENMEYYRYLEETLRFLLKKVGHHTIKGKFKIFIQLVLLKKYL